MFFILILPIGYLLIMGIMPQIGQLNNIVARPGSPSRVIPICNRAICGSSLVSKHFLSVHFTNFIHASTCPLVWQGYNEENPCSIFRLLQKVLNLSEMKLSPESDIFFLGSPFSAKINLHIGIRLSVHKPSVFMMKGNLL